MNVANIYLLNHVQGIQIKSNAILIFGGTAGSYILKLKEKGSNLQRHAEIEGSPSFNTTFAPIFNGRKVFGVSNTGAVYTYSVTEKLWSKYRS